VGYLVHIVAALLVAALAEEGFASGLELPLAVLALAAVPYVLAAFARRASLRGRFGRAGWLLLALHASPPLLHAAAVLGCGWYATLERLTGAEPHLFGWPRPASLLALAPFVLYALLAIDARARATHRHIEGVVRTWRFQGRMLLSALAPLAVYVLIAWAVGSSEELRARIDHMQAWGALFAAALVALFLTLLPYLLRYTWDTVPLGAGPLRAVLDALSARARFRCSQVLIWRTENQMANAAVVGLWPRSRVVLLSDALLAQLHPDETLAVFAHEIGHARRHHVLVFVAWSVAFFMGIDLLAVQWLPGGALPAGAVLLASLVAWYLGFGWLSRRFELDADVFSAELLDDPEPMVRALESVGGPHGRGRRTWRHFSPADRVDFLRRLAREPELGRRLRRRLRVLAGTGAALATLALAGEVAGIVAAYPADSVRVELALGRYDRAIARLAPMADPPVRLARQVILGAGLAGRDGRVEASTLMERALDVLADGDLGPALDLLELAALRSDRDAGELVAELAPLEGPSDSSEWSAAAAGLEDAHPRWAAALRRATLLRAGPDG
jgi:Zn-dependent protease with chaperone function